MRRVSARIALAGVCWCAPVFAADPLNSSNRPSHDTEAGIRPAAEDAGQEQRATNEFNLLPVVGGSTDLGFGGGFFGGLARVKKGYEPYLWNIDSSGLVTFKFKEREGWSVPYQDLYARLTVPRLFGSPLRLELRPSYTWETIDYFGMGNESTTAAPAGAPSNYFKYERGHPQFDVDLRGRIIDHVAGRMGFRYIQNFIRSAADSKLAQDQGSGTGEVRNLVGSTASHSVLLFKYGIQWDDRDNEASTHAGSFHTFDLKLSPGGIEPFPFRYGEATINLRAFIPLWKPRLTLAARVVGDWMFGNPPFYELARFDDTFAVGGTNGVRGIPAQRYYGKVKILGNVELRVEIVSFHALGKPMVLGVVPFFDAGRVWADTTFHPELDGRGIGIKYGVGGGIRLQSGSAFVLRLDVAGSPVADGISGYFSAGQMF